jgi:hypothetical protein
VPFDWLFLIALTQASAGNPDLSRNKFRGRTTQGAPSTWLISKFVTQESTAARFQRNRSRGEITAATQHPAPGEEPAQSSSACYCEQSSATRTTARSFRFPLPCPNNSSWKRESAIPCIATATSLSLLSRTSAMPFSVTTISHRWGLCQECTIHPANHRSRNHDQLDATRQCHKVTVRWRGTHRR